MIVSSTPYRVSFAGGGTDLPAYCDHRWGLVLSCAIRDRLTVRLDPDAEQDGDYDPHIRACLDHLAVPGRPRIAVEADIPGGTGLGSSSVLTVGILAALHAYLMHPHVRPNRLAEEACIVEIERMGKPIGRQDQYAAAYGGLATLQFRERGLVRREPLPVPDEVIAALESMLVLYRVGGKRGATEILTRQAEATPGRMPTLTRMRDIAFEMSFRLLAGHLSRFAGLLDESWQLKRSLGCGISNPEVDAAVRVAKAWGATACKLLGAGGGGYLLVMAPDICHRDIALALGKPESIPFRIGRRGCHIAEATS